MRKVLLSIGSGPHEALLEITRPTFADYARRHGYELRTSTRADPERPAAWAKVAALRTALENADLALWIDADAAVVDPSRDIAEELAPGQDLALTQHRRGRWLVPNSGVMVLRATPLTRSLLARVWDGTRFLHHPWWENAALIDALGYDLPGRFEPGLRGRAHRLGARVRRREPRPCGPARPSRFLDATRFLGTEWNSIHEDPAARPRIVHCLGTPVDQRRRDLATIVGAARRSA